MRVRRTGDGSVRQRPRATDTHHGARARNRAVADRLLELIAQYKRYLSRFGGTFDDNPSPGNKEGGLTNILEKSLGAVAKAFGVAARDVELVSGATARTKVLRLTGDPVRLAARRAELLGQD